MKLRHLIALTAVALALPASAGAASSGTFKVTGSGSQSVSWTLDGTRGSCEIRHGAGSGTSDLTFKTAKSSTLYVSKSGGIVGSVPTKASGSQSGSFGETTATACEGFEPSAPFTADASGCGAYKTGVRIDFKTKSGLTWAVGPATPLPSGPCPSYGDQLLSSDLNQCGDSNTMYKRSWGIASGGVGLLAAKTNVSMKTLLKVKKGKKKTITFKTSVDCSPQSTWSNPVAIKASMKYSLVFKRTS